MPTTTTTLRPGSRPGFVEVIFDAKPAPAELADLKASGFRFTPRQDPPRWYGLAHRAPAAYAQGIAALAAVSGLTLTHPSARLEAL